MTIKYSAVILLHMETDNILKRTRLNAELNRLAKSCGAYSDMEEAIKVLFRENPDASSEDKIKVKLTVLKGRIDEDSYKKVSEKAVEIMPPLKPSLSGS